MLHQTITNNKMETKKITLATFKSFIKKNKEVLLINQVSKFCGMSDMVEYSKEEAFTKVKEADGNLKNNLGIVGLWLVGSSRDYFTAYEDEKYTGIEVYNCCGSQIIAIAKEVVLEEEYEIEKIVKKSVILYSEERRFIKMFKYNNSHWVFSLPIQSMYLDTLEKVKESIEKQKKENELKGWECEYKIAEIEGTLGTFTNIKI
ncbi:hypothetical protein F132_20 [Flavobacterium sp. phage 1/32]|nr:hypothetical protein F132_20 [Flavobacterium sp. phage 1/32]